MKNAHVQVVQVDTLYAQLSSELAKERGFTELVASNYTEDMKKMYALVAIGTHVCMMDYNICVVLQDTLKAHSIVQMAYWGHGRLYDSSKLQCYTIAGIKGLFVLYDNDAEWVL